MSEKTQVEWRVNTGGLLKEILENPGMGILIAPLSIFSSLLQEVGKRAAELNDPKLNALMCRLAIYSIADPYDPDYDEQTVKTILSQAGGD